MKFTEFYHGQSIEIETQQKSDGTWTASAQLPAQSGADAATLSQPAFGQTEDEAKLAALSAAAGALDQRRIHTGKP
jgi:hypothetical protein